MREIKFRAWDKRTRKMIDTGFHVLGETTCFDLIYDYCMKHGRRKDEVGLLRINSVVIMQYTGRKDKNGKEIYEGDILRLSPMITDTNVRHLAVSYEDVFWHLIEIIGNIYENPELLEAVK